MSDIRRMYQREISEGLRQRETGVKRAGHMCAKRKAESDGGEGRGADINE